MLARARVDHRQALVDLARGLLGLHGAFGEHPAQPIVLRRDGTGQRLLRRGQAVGQRLLLLRQPRVLRRERRRHRLGQHPGRLAEAVGQRLFLGQQPFPLRGERGIRGGAGFGEAVRQQALLRREPLARHGRLPVLRRAQGVQLAGERREGLSAMGGRAADQQQHHHANREQNEQTQKEGQRVIGQVRNSANQWRKCRMPVKTIASPASSAAAITSASRIEPPGWITAVAPAAAAACKPVGEGKEGVGGDHAAARQRLGEARRARASSAFQAAMRALSTRLICPAPMPTVAPPLA